MTPPTATPPLVPGRDCGSCNVCCVALTINEPTLQKLQGFRCRHAQRDNGCAIYESRPPTCRAFYCGWRLLKWVREPLRPDTSGVLIRLHNEVSADGATRLGIVLTLLHAAALKAEGLAETVAAAVAADIPLYLHVPGPPGRTSGQARINAPLRHAVHTKDKPAVLEFLRAARARGLTGPHRRIVLPAPLAS